MANTLGQNFTPQQEDMLQIIQYLQEQLLLRQQQTEEINQQVEEVQKEINLQQQELEINEQAAELRKEMRDVDWRRLGFVKGIVERVERELSLAGKLNKFAQEELKQKIKIDVLNTAIDEAGTNSILKDKLEALRVTAEIEQALQKKMHTAQLGIYSNIIPPGLAGKIGTALSSPAFAAAQVVGQFFFSMAGLFWKLIKGVLGFLWARLKEIWGVFLDIEKEIGNLTADLGMSVVQSASLYSNIRQIGIAALEWGVTFKEALGFMRSFSDATGINRVFLAEQVTLLSKIAKVTGLGVEETGRMHAEMELLGYSTSGFYNYVNKARQDAGRLNLNITKLLTTVNSLLPAFRGLNFKDGIDGLTRIVEKAQGLRFELTNMQSLANKVFNPEGAIELAAQLRVLGGGFAAIADPFNLMLKGQTDAAGLMEDVMSTMSVLAVKGDKGIFSIPPVQQALIREFAAATGENADNMIKGSIQMAKQADIISRIRFGSILDPKDRELIGNLAEMDDKGSYTIKVDASGTKVAVENLTAGQLTAIKAYRTQEDIVARNRMNIVEKFQNIYQMLLVSLAPLFQKVSDALQSSGFLSSLMDKVKTFGEKLGNYLAEIITSGKLEKLFGSFMSILDQVLNILTGEGSITRKIIDAIKLVVKEVLNEVMPVIAGMLNQSGVGSAIRGSAAGMGGLYGAGAGVISGALIGSIFPVIGTAIGAIAGGIIGALSGGGLGYGVANKVIPNTARDFIMRSDGTVQHFSQDDLIIGGTKLAPKPNENVTNMVSSRSILEQTKTYNRNQFSSLNTGGGGGSNNTGPVNLNLTGTVLVQGQDNSVYLTSADLKNIGIQQLAYAIRNENERWNNHGSGKRLQSEIIAPIGTT